MLVLAQAACCLAGIAANEAQLLLSCSSKCRAQLLQKLLSSSLYCVVQVRLMLVLAPAACCLAGIAANEALLTLSRSVRGRLASKQNSVLEGSVNLDKGAQAEQQSEEVTSGKGSGRRSAKKSSDSKVCPSQLSQC